LKNQHIKRSLQHLAVERRLAFGHGLILLQSTIDRSHTPIYAGSLISFAKIFRRLTSGPETPVPGYS
jgi:hypothetical protein